jgi:hypothetical protein
MRFIVVVCMLGLTVIAGATLLAGCLDDMPATAQPDAGFQHPNRPAYVMATARLPENEQQPDLAQSADLLLPPPPPDLAPSDLTGLIDCYGKAYCDQATMFCLRFFGGSPGKPQPEKVGPSCYAPQDPCPNGTLDCACIQQDAVLGPSCAECFDNKDGTFTCYAQ